jgi:hypothetical protein
VTAGTSEAEAAEAAGARNSAGRASPASGGDTALPGPVGPNDHVFVNHGRRDLPLAVFDARMFGKRNSSSHVAANPRANDVAAMPILYRLA